MRTKKHNIPVYAWLIIIAIIALFVYSVVITIKYVY